MMFYNQEAKDRFIKYTKSDQSKARARTLFKRTKLFEAALEKDFGDFTQDKACDLLAMRTYFDCGVITVGVIITRAENLNEVFSKLGKEVEMKYGASTTWMGKLTYRLDSRRNGGCPILAIGATKECVI